MNKSTLTNANIVIGIFLLSLQLFVLSSYEAFRRAFCSFPCEVDKLCVVKPCNATDVFLRYPLLMLAITFLLIAALIYLRPIKTFNLCVAIAILVSPEVLRLLTACCIEDSEGYMVIFILSGYFLAVLSFLLYLLRGNAKYMAVATALLSLSLVNVLSLSVPGIFVR